MSLERTAAPVARQARLKATGKCRLSGGRQDGKSSRLARPPLSSPEVLGASFRDVEAQHLTFFPAATTPASAREASQDRDRAVKQLQDPEEGRQGCQLPKKVPAREFLEQGSDRPASSQDLAFCSPCMQLPQRLAVADAGAEEFSRILADVAPVDRTLLVEPSPEAGLTPAEGAGTIIEDRQAGSGL